MFQKLLAKSWVWLCTRRQVGPRGRGRVTGSSPGEVQGGIGVPGEPGGHGIWVGEVEGLPWEG